MVEDLLQVVGALLILAPFAALQFNRTTSDAPVYLWPNLVGSALLAYLAVVEEQWGFLLLEAVWAMVAAWGLARRRPAADPAAAGR